MKENNIKKNDLKIVLIADRTFRAYNDFDIDADDLDMINDEYFQSIITGLNSIGSVIHYNTLKEFIDNIKIHKDNLVLSIYGGNNSRNRLSLAPAICEAYGIKYVGADTYIKIISQDKYLSKKFIRDFGIKTAESILVENLKELYFIETLKLPIVIKPNSENSSIGINDNSLVYSYNEAIEVAKKAFIKKKPILLEEFIPGKEVSICIVGTSKNIQHLEAIEYYSEKKQNFFDNHLLTAFIQRKSTEINKRLITYELSDIELKKLKRIFLSLGKIDHFRIDGKLLNGSFIFIEMTPTPVLDKDCAMAFSYLSKGMSYRDFLKRIIDNTLSYYHNLKSNEPKN